MMSSVLARSVLPKAFGDIRDATLRIGQCLDDRPSFGIQQSALAER